MGGLEFQGGSLDWYSEGKGGGCLGLEFQKARGGGGGG